MVLIKFVLFILLIHILQNEGAKSLEKDEKSAEKSNWLSNAMKRWKTYRNEKNVEKMKVEKERNAKKIVQMKSENKGLLAKNEELRRGIVEFTGIKYYEDKLKLKKKAKNNALSAYERGKCNEYIGIYKELIAEKVEKIGNSRAWIWQNEAKIASNEKKIARNEEKIVKITEALEQSQKD